LRIYGQSALRAKAELEKSFYNTVLIKGDPHIGKQTLAMSVAHFHGFLHPVHISRLTPASAKYIASDASKATSQGYVINVSEATEQSQNILLKTLEDVQPGVMFLLTSSTPVLDTVSSRMQAIFLLSRLSSDDVMQVLRDRGVPKDVLADAARLSDGTLKKPLDNLTDQRNTIIRALKAIHDHDPVALSRQSAVWDDNTTELLKVWCTESITQQWKIFTPEDALFSGTQVPLSILLAVSKNIRPKLIVRSSLMGLI